MGTTADYGGHMMNKSKKARPDAGTSGQAVREDALQGNASRIQFNTADGGGQGSIAIADYLSHGQANAIPLRDLERMTGLDPRHDCRRTAYRRGHP